MLTILPHPSEQVAPDKRTRHLPVLDGLRGVAIVMVSGGHFFQKAFFSGDPLIGKLCGRIAGMGAYGVELFFVLSGFLITGILLDNKDSPGSLRKFYVRRCLRIFPLYYLALTILFVLLPHFIPFDEGARAIAARQGWLWTYLANWPALGWIWDDSSIFLIGHFWTLCVEEHFYLFWPALVYLLPRAKLPSACLLVILAGILSRLVTAIMGADTPNLLQWSTLQKIDGLAIGALLAVAVRDPQWTARLPAGRWFRRGLLLLGIAVLGLVAIPLRMHTPILGVASETIISAFCGFVVLGALRSQGARPAQFQNKFGKFLQWELLMVFGKYSYGLYVIHGILRPQFNWLLKIIDAAPQFAGAPIVYQSLYYLVAGGVSFILAYASFHLFEKHFLSLKRFASYQSESRL